MKVLGRMLEHLGVQMYKRRDTAIAELVANAWDAGAHNVWVTVPAPDEYDAATSTIVIRDDGDGMSPDQVQDDYLVVGRNRRAQSDTYKGRPVMGRKGIGKLAGFGIASTMQVATWRDGQETEIALDIRELKREAGQVGDIPIAGVVRQTQGGGTPAGTRVTLSQLKQKTPLDISLLRESLARRLSRTVRGELNIHVNSDIVGDPTIEYEYRTPTEGITTATLSDANAVSFFFGFSKTVLQSKELRGFTILVRGKTAQAPPWFFNVEATASGQHGTRYLTGVIEADYLDAGVDDESDLVSTDRQEIDWEDEKTQPLLQWGAQITRDALREYAERKAERMKSHILDDEGLRARIEALDKPSRDQLMRLIGILGRGDTDDERSLELADALIMAYEYRHFHDVLGQIEAIGDDPEQLATLLDHIKQWKVMESRAILEIIHGRLDIIAKFGTMVVNDAAETAGAVGMENLHDLIGGYPWLLNPEWQVLAEEKTISTQLREWGQQDIENSDERQRYDFLALADESQLVVVEIKRSGYTAELSDLQRLETYKAKLERARSNLYMVFLNNGQFGFDVSPWRERPDIDLLTWREVYERTRNYYEHYRAVLEGDVSSRDFASKEAEVARTRHVLDRGAYRSPAERKKGLGEQDKPR